MPDAFGNFTPPKNRGLPYHAKRILEATYSSCRLDSSDKAKCARISWGAVHNAGYKELSFGRWVKE